MMRTCSILTLAACLAAWPARAADWPQLRGPDRSGVSQETGLLKTWPRTGPKLVWTYANAGTGFAGMAVVAGRVYTMGCRGTTEYVLALDAKGQELWSARIGPLFDFDINRWSRGPNATPAVDGGRVYALGSQGVLVCVDAARGTVLWQKDLPRELGAEVNPVGGAPAGKGWGFAWSPLVDGRQLICTPGGPRGLLAGLDKMTGEVLWRSKEVTAQATYSSPILAEVSGTRQVIQVTQDGVVGVAVKDGTLLWQYKREDPYPEFVCPTPVCRGNRVYVTAGWGAGCDLIELTPAGQKFTARAVYSEKEIANRLGGVVLVGDSLYGYHDTRAWECQDFATGAIKWSARGRRALGLGSVIAADGSLYCLAENGEAALLQASPEKYTQQGRFKLPRESSQRKEGGKVWTYPSLADGHLYLRDQELIFCYRIK
jgi:outer membrane protein assembly factor BamB